MRKPSHKISRRAALRAAAAVPAMLALAGCSLGNTLNPSETLVHGYVIDEQALELVPIGSSREQVELALGTPSTRATFNDEAFYYISQTRKRNVAFQRMRVIDQRILAVYFGEEGRVNNIANYGLQDGKVFDFISRTTPTAGNETSFIRQMITGLSSGQAPNIFGGG